MSAGRALLVVFSSLFSIDGASAQTLAPSVGSTTVIVPAAPAIGFHFPYVLKVPQPAGDTLLVLSNNTGFTTDDFDVHLDAALLVVERGPGALTGRRLALPILVPVFPRPANDRTVYTHALDRDTLEITAGALARLDLQLLAMVDDALARLRTRGIVLHTTIAMIGFSASGTFANRFAFLHPERVAVVVSGGINGIPMLPVEALAGTRLPYPLGLADFEALTGSPFDFAGWARIPQFIFMGAEDSNDTLPFEDAFSEPEKEIIRTVIGEKMLPDRWGTSRATYAAIDTRAEFRTYAGIGHGTNAAINADIVDFVRNALEAARAE